MNWDKTKKLYGESNSFEAHHLFTLISFALSLSVYQDDWNEESYIVVFKSAVLKFLCAMNATHLIIKFLRDWFSSNNDRTNFSLMFFVSLSLRYTDLMQVFIKYSKHFKIKLDGYSLSHAFRLPSHVVYVYLYISLDPRSHGQEFPIISSCAS